MSKSNVTNKTNSRILNAIGIVDPVAPPSGRHIKKMPKKEGVTIVTLGSIIYWVLTGQLDAYRHNRGNGQLAKATVDSAYAGVKVDCIGEFIIGRKDGEWVISDAHSRLGGFIKRFADGKMTQKELETQVAVRVAKNHLVSYQGANSGRPHRTKDKIINPDLAYGPILEEIREALGEDCMKMIGDNKWTVFSSIVYNLASPSGNWNWPHVYQKRGVAMSVANEKAGHFHISRANMKRLIEAIDYWYQLMVALDATGKASGAKEVSKVVNNAGMFGFIVCDRMWTQPNFSSKNVMVKKIIRNLTKVVDACPELCRGNKYTVLKFTSHLEEIFRQRKKVA